MYHREAIIFDLDVLFAQLPPLFFSSHCILHYAQTV